MHGAISGYYITVLSIVLYRKSVPNEYQCYNVTNIAHCFYSRLTMDGAYIRSDSYYYYY